MPILAGLLLILGWLGVLAMGDLALIEHGLMMPVMLIPMLLRLDVYTGRQASRTMAALVEDLAPLTGRLYGDTFKLNIMVFCDVAVSHPARGMRHVEQDVDGLAGAHQHRVVPDEILLGVRSRAAEP